MDVAGLAHPAPAGGCCVQQLVTGSCLTFSGSGRRCSGNGGQLPPPNACKDAPSIVQCQSPDLDAACNGKNDGDACTYQVQNFYSYDGACAGHYMCP